MADPHPPPTLLTTPPELRNRIYSYAIPNGVTQKQEFRFGFSVSATIPALLQVSEQVRSEALGLYYGTAHFELVMHHRGTWQVAQWVSLLPPKAKKYLHENGNVSLRVVFDHYHKDFSTFRHDLSSLAVWGFDNGWWAAAEHHKCERSAIRLMSGIDRLRGSEEQRKRALQTGKQDGTGAGNEVGRKGGFKPGASKEREEGRKRLHFEMERISEKVFTLLKR
ncbi:hypothetical protein LTR36_002204 [Oleoguttula mirabilis]|uniref:Uncharacterized protein n=1 Tax=Oleoguttula mirabilis TaxID=1507867 RepID=A0AAV9JKR2_9PEZI|nr:hypothetical protein LTR36_002204 [Oleoguttula mirabilis]